MDSSNKGVYFTLKKGKIIRKKAKLQKGKNLLRIPCLGAGGSASERLYVELSPTSFANRQKAANLGGGGGGGGESRHTIEI